MVQQKHKKPMRIHLAGNDDHHFRTIQKILTDSEAPRFGVHGVTSLAHAVEVLNEWTFDAVLLDLFLPNSQGLEPLAHIQKAGRWDSEALPGILPPVKKMSWS